MKGINRVNDRVNAGSTIGVLCALVALACLPSCLGARPTAPDHDGSVSDGQGGAMGGNGGPAGSGGISGGGGAVGSGGSMAIGGSDGTGKGGSAGGNGIGGSGTGSGGKVGTGGAGAGGSTLTPAHLTIAGSGGVPASAVIADTVTATFAITNNGQQTSGALTYALDGDPNFYYGRDPVNPCTSGVTTLAAGEVCLVQLLFQPAALGPVTAQLSMTWVGGNMTTYIGWTASGTAPPSGSVHMFLILPLDATDVKQGSDGNMWFADYADNRIGRMTVTGNPMFFDVPTANSGAGRLALGPDNNIWFTETLAGKVGRITPSGQITEFVCPTVGSMPYGITAGPDGNLWYAANSASSATIGRVTTGGAITEFQTPGATPWDITTGPDKNLWFSDSNGNLARITTAGVITKFPTPTAGAAPIAITTGRDGNLWYTTFNFGNGGIVGRMTTGGVATEFPTDWSGAVHGIVAGPDNDIWFTVTTGEIVRITPTGTQTKFTLTTTPGGITAASDGNIWVAQRNYIVRVTP